MRIRAGKDWHCYSLPYRHSSNHKAAPTPTFVPCDTTPPSVACRFASPKPEESTGYSRQCWPHSQGRAHTTSGRINRGGEPPDGLALYPLKYECTLSLGFGLLDSTSRHVYRYPSTSLWAPPWMDRPHKPQRLCQRMQLACTYLGVCMQSML